MRVHEQVLLGFQRTDGPKQGGKPGAQPPEGNNWSRGGLDRTCLLITGQEGNPPANTGGEILLVREEKEESHCAR